MGMNDITACRSARGPPKPPRPTTARSARISVIAPICPAQLKALLEADPEFSLGHCFRGVTRC